jgi:glutathione S-transferase
MVKVSAFAWVPPLRKDWCETFTPLGARRAGIAYEERLVGPEDKTSKSYRGLQPFGQVPAYENGELKLFESGHRHAHRNLFDGSQFRVL